MKLVIYLPALNEEENIQSVIAALPKALDGIDSIQYLVIDDGSTDRTAERALVAGAQVLSHGRNRGVGAAFHSAVQFALEHGADVMVGIDADGQFEPTEIPSIIEVILSKKADMVVGNRFGQGIPQSMSIIKYWGNTQVSNLVGSVCGQKYRDVSCGFRAYSRESLFRLNIFGEFTYTHESILSLSYQGLRIQEYPVTVKYDPKRKSRVAASILRYAVQTSKIILRVMLDYRPIQVFGGIGGMCLLIGAGLEVFLLGHYVLTHSFTPYKAVGFIGLGFVIFGMLALLIALIADMLNRMRINQNKILYELKKIRYDSGSSG